MNGPVQDQSKYFRELIPLLPPGHIAEFGCYDMGSTRQLATYGRSVFAFDTYRGLPQGDFKAELDSSNNPGKFHPTGAIQDMIDGHWNIIPVVGRFQDTFKYFPPELRFAFAYLDCDYYASQKQIFEFLVPRLIPGGCFITDDYSLPGVRKATDEFLAEHPEWKLVDDRIFIRKGLVEPVATVIAPQSSILTGTFELRLFPKEIK